MNLASFGKTDIGKAREINQDSFGIFKKDNAQLFVLADGMGGYTNGEKASQTVVSEMSKWWGSFSPDMYDCEFEKMLSAIEQVISCANRIIFEQYNKDEVCGTTVVVLFIFGERYSILYAGDSRCYMASGWKFSCLTIDEVWENQAHLSVSERKMKNHPNRGKLVNAVGTRESMQCRVLTGVVTNGAVFLLCSDGLYKYCSDSYIKSCMRRCRDKSAIEPQVNNLIGRVYKNGAADNVTIVIVKCGI